MNNKPAITRRLQLLVTQKPMYIKPLMAKSLALRLARITPDYFETKVSDPTFIIGTNRSGTTLLVNTLAIHKGIATYPDEALDLWHPQTYPWRHSVHKDTIPPIEVDPAEFTTLSLNYRTPKQERYLRAVFGSFQYLLQREHFLNKSAMITFMIPYVMEQFPNAKFIHIYRDGRAVVRSWAEKVNRIIQENIELYENQRFGVSYNDLVANCAYSWQQQMEEVATQKRRLGLEEKGIFLELKYEDFCRNPRDLLIRLAEFIGVSPQVFADRTYDHIKSRNYKFQEEFTEEQLLEITQIMEPALLRLGYL